MSIETSARIALRLRHLTRTAPNIGYDPPEWTLDALCRQFPHEWFYPEQGGDDRPGKRVCADCPVVPECLADALHDPIESDFGTRGGLSERERRKLRRAGAA